MVKISKVEGFNDQGTTVEFTVVQKFNQGTIPKSGCISISGALFGYLFGQTKRYNDHCKMNFKNTLNVYL